MIRAVKPRIGNQCTASGDLCIRISGINRVLFSYCFRQFFRFRSDTHCFDCWRLDRDFTVTASLTVINGNFNAIRDEGSKAFRNCMDAEAGSDPRGHLGVTWGVYLCAGKPPLADIILSHPPDLT